LLLIQYKMQKKKKVNYPKLLNSDVHFFQIFKLFLLLLLLLNANVVILKLMICQLQIFPVAIVF